jgi:hypothetical protein
MTSQPFPTIPFLISNQHLFNMLYRKIIATFLSLCELILGLTILILWTLAYPLLRMNFFRTNKYKDYPSILLFKAFVWTNNLFKYDYFKK